jgi:hypothetical protein
MHSTTSCICQHSIHGSTIGNGPARDFWLDTSSVGSLLARSMHVKIKGVLVQSRICACASFRAPNTCHVQTLQTRKIASREKTPSPYRATDRFSNYANDLLRVRHSIALAKTFRLVSSRKSLFDLGSCPSFKLSTQHSRHDQKTSGMALIEMTIRFNTSSIEFQKVMH